MKNTIIRIALAVFTIYLLLGASNVYSQTAPTFSLPSQNADINLKQYRGKVVLLDFWASWCTPCVQSFSWMNEMQERYGKDGFKIIAVNLGESTKDAENFLKKVPAKFDIAYDPKGRTADVYKLSVMPSSFLINKKGQLIYKHRGFNGTDKKLLESKIRKLVGYQDIASK